MLPNFLLIGAAKAGTTSIHRYLGQHPEIFMSRDKEPGYFAFAETDGHIPMIRDQPFVTDLARYEALFEDARDASIVGESSPYYLDFADTALVDRIRSRIPEVRLLAVLRQPVDQAYSRFVMWQRLGRGDGVAFRDRFLADMPGFHDLRHDLRGGEALVKSYHDRLRLFTEAFRATQIKITLYDDLVADPKRFMEDIYRFLGVDRSFQNDFSARSNPGGLYRSAALAALMNRPNPVRWVARRLLPARTRLHAREALYMRLSKPAPKLDVAVRRELSVLLDDEISDLERLTGRDLTPWRAT